MYDEVVAVAVMDDGDALQILLRGETDPDGSGRELVRALGGHPLAIDWSGGMLRAGTNAAELLLWAREEGLAKMFASFRGTWEYNATRGITALIDRSVSMLADTAVDRVAREVLFEVAASAAGSVSTRFLERTSGIPVSVARGRLDQLHLLSRVPGSAMHPLLRAALRTRAEAAAAASRVLERVLPWIDATVNSSAFLDWRDETSHLVALLRTGEPPAQIWCRAALRTAQLLKVQARHVEGRTLLDEAVARWPTLDRLRGELLLELSIKAGYLAGGPDPYREALGYADAAVRVLAGVDRAVLANAERHRALVYGLRGDRAHARDLLQRLVPEFEALGDSVELGRTLKQLASAQARVGDHQIALATFARAAAMLASTFTAENDPGEANLLKEAAYSLAALGRFEEALNNYRRALAILETRVGASHPAVAATLHNIGVMHNNWWKARQRGAAGPDDCAAQALAAFERALRIRLDCEQEGSPRVATSHFAIGELLVGLGRHQEAITPLGHAVAIRSRMASAGKGGGAPAKDLAHAAWELVRARYGAGDKPSRDEAWRALQALEMTHPNQRTKIRSHARQWFYSHY